jgi:sigma-B regulation protein RsbU (phosphoserine phosphatase)
MAGAPPARGSIPAPPDAGRCGTPWGPAWFEPIPGRSGHWLEAEPGVGVPLIARAALVVAGALDDEARRSELVRTLAERHEEIRLLYAISDILGRTTRLDEAARTIVQEVALVVGARRASIMVHDPVAGLLRTVAAAGFETGPDEAVRVDDPTSVAARVFRERAALAYEPPDADTVPRGRYRGVAFLSVPITYAAPGQTPRCVGVINLTDRVGGDRFTPANRQLVGAIASQIGAALENARLAERERAEQRLRRELEIAHDLQLALLPSPVALRGDADVAVRCVPVEEIGGDFYTFARLGQGRVGVMLGDVASHGFASALVMALALSAAGIHAAAARSPEETLAALHESVQAELARTEMYLTVFYGMFDPATRTLQFSNAGHPYAWRIMPDGLCGRLGATAPPMGLADGMPLGAAEVSWDPDDLLLLCTDGLLDAPSPEGVPFGEERLLRTALAARAGGVRAVLDGVLSAVAAWSPTATDDRTLLVMQFGAGA